MVKKIFKRDVLGTHSLWGEVEWVLSYLVFSFEDIYKSSTTDLGKKGIP